MELCHGLFSLVWDLDSGKHPFFMAGNFTVNHFRFFIYCIYIYICTWHISIVVYSVYVYSIYIIYYSIYIYMVSILYT